MTEPIKIEDTPVGEEIKVEVPAPDTDAVNPQMIITTKRKTPIKRSDTDRMTTDSGRFRES